MSAHVLARVCVYASVPPVTGVHMPACVRGPPAGPPAHPPCIFSRNGRSRHPYAHACMRVPVCARGPPAHPPNTRPPCIFSRNGRSRSLIWRHASRMAAPYMSEEALAAVGEELGTCVAVGGRAGGVRCWGLS